MPRLTVVVPAHNAEPYLRQALTSIEEQTYPDVGIVLVDDGSTDATPAILEEFSRSGANRSFIRHEQPRGLAATLNAVVPQLDAELVARMDADDISLPTRFAEQVDFLDRTPDVDMVGCWVDRFSDPDRPGKPMQYPTDHEEIRTLLTLKTGMAHATWVFRLSSWRKNGVGYDESYPVAQDYDLLVRNANRIRLANVPRVLYRYRQYPEQVSKKNPEKQRRSTELALRAFENFGVRPDDTEKAALVALLERTKADSVATVQGWIDSTAGLFDRAGIDPSRFPMVEAALARLAFMLYRNNASLGVRTLSRARSDRFARHYRASVRTWVSFLAGTVRSRKH
jgi:glycosyltransferase involved in cell wall biosynthesis